MKKGNLLMHKVITYLLLFLCATCISFHLTLYEVQSVQEVQDSQLASINHEYNNSGDGNNNSISHKLISNKFNRINIINTCGLLFFLAGTFNIIFAIQNSEFYIYEHDYFSKIYTSSLVSQKIRLNN